MLQHHYMAALLWTSLPVTERMDKWNETANNKNVSYTAISTGKRLNIEVKPFSSISVSCFMEKLGSVCLCVCVCVLFIRERGEYGHSYILFSV